MKKARAASRSALSPTCLPTALVVIAALHVSPAAAQLDDVSRLAAALLGATALDSDLRVLTDEMGGRPTGSKANREAFEWAYARLREAGAPVRRESFEMPALWLERSARVEVGGFFSPRVAAMPYSTATPAGGLTARLLDGGVGSEDDFTRLGESAKGAFVIVETSELVDVPGLFVEYATAADIEGRAFAAGVAGLVYMGSRPRNLLHRQNASLGPRNQHPMLIMERDGAQRVLRLLRKGVELEMKAEIDVESGGPYEAYNLVAEFRGRERPEEVVVLGAHLDSWGLGTGALDNGCNVSMLIDIARQMQRLGIRAKRTIRIALWNGEEQGLFGSWGYVKRHADELDRHVMASSYDIGSGRIVGYFTGGRPELAAATRRALGPVEGLGPFEILDIPVVGTDHFDFMMEGVGALVANQESANYGPNYHARSDTYDKVDLKQVRLNGAIAAAVTYGFAEMDIDWGRQSRAEVEELVNGSDLVDQMRSFNLLEDWLAGRRGRRAE